MHNAALQALGLDGVYVAFDVTPRELTAAVRGLQALGVGGVNCTIPHKEALLEIVDELSEPARWIGAVNTLVFRDGRMEGHNTDAPGFLAALRAAGFDPAGRRIVVLGAGGSARAVVAALGRAARSIRIANRTPGRAEALVDQFRTGFAAAGGASLSLETVAWEGPALAEAVQGADLLVNTTSVGMAPRVAEMPPVPAAAFHPGLLVYDLIYNPLETRLLRIAREQGARGCHGAGMLAHQGALALELWTGCPAPADRMEQVILESLSARKQERGRSVVNR